MNHTSQGCADNFERAVLLWIRQNHKWSVKLKKVWRVCAIIAVLCLEPGVASKPFLKESRHSSGSEQSPPDAQSDPGDDRPARSCKLSPSVS